MHNIVLQILVYEALTAKLFTEMNESALNNIGSSRTSPENTDWESVCEEEQLVAFYNLYINKSND